jgi:hypothetical protein
MGSYKEIFLQMQPNLVSLFKIVGNLVLIMALLVLNIEFIQNIMEILVDVLNLFNEFGSFFNLRLSMGILCLFGCKGKCYINGAQWLKSKAHLKRVVVGRAMEGSIVAMLEIRKALIPCAWMLGVVHAQHMHNHPIDDLYLSNSFKVEGNGFGKLGFQQ